MSKHSQKVGCAGSGCTRAATCALHTLASEMQSIDARLCSPERQDFPRYEHLPDRPAQVVVLQAEWVTMPRAPIPPNSVFDLGRRAA